MIRKKRTHDSGVQLMSRSGNAAHMFTRWGMRIVELEINCDQMLVSRRDVKDFIVGDALARSRREKAGGH